MGNYIEIWDEEKKCWVKKRNKNGEYVKAWHTASKDKKYPNRYDVICGNCEKTTNVFIIDYDTGFVEGIYFYCPHCGELNRYYSV